MATAGQPANVWKRWWVSGLLVVAVIGAFSIAADYLPGLPPEKTDRTKISYSRFPTNSVLAINLESLPDHAVQWTAIQIAVDFANSSERDIEVKQSWRSDCFQVETEPNNPTVRSKSKNNVTVRIPAASSVALVILLTPICKSGYHQLSVDSYWRANANTYAATAAISPILVTSRWRLDLLRFFTLCAAVLRVLAIPALLIFLGIWLQQKTSERDNRLKELQEERDRREDILKTLIPDYSELVQEHYLQICRRMQTIDAELPAYLKTPDPATLQTFLCTDDLWRVFCAILLFRVRLQHFLKQKGGIYFRSKHAERLLQILLGEFLREVYAQLEKDDFRNAVDSLQPEDTLAAALQKCKTGAIRENLKDAEIETNKLAFEGLLKRFEAWILKDPLEFRAYTRVVLLMLEIFVFECDRPFYQTGPSDAGGKNSGWYFDPPILEITSDMYDLPRTLKEDPTFETALKICKYLDGVPAECRAGVPYPMIMGDPDAKWLPLR